jgi:hypothetical protein
MSTGPALRRVARAGRGCKLPIVTWLLAFFLAAHGLIHASFLSPKPKEHRGPHLPFNLDSSWLFESAGRPLGVLLVYVTAAVFLLAAASSVGLFVPGAWWQTLVKLGSASGALLLVIFFEAWLTLGVLINLGLLYAVLRLGWTIVKA